MREEILVFDGTPRDFGRDLIGVFLVRGEKNILIESGTRNTAHYVIEKLNELGINPDLLIVTHIHLDHGGGAGSLVKEYPSLKVIVHPKGYKHLINPSKLWTASRSVLGPIAEIYGEPIPIPKENLVQAEENMVVDVGGGKRLKIIFSPGHASHHLSVLYEPYGIMFTGDSAGISIEFNGKRIRLPTTPPPLRPEYYMDSLDKMLAYKPSRIVLTHYGFDPLPGVDYLKKHKEQMLKWLETAEKLVKEGVTDINEAGERLAYLVPEAGEAYRSGNPIIVETFYKSTVWGMIEYFKQKYGEK